MPTPASTSIRSAWDSLDDGQRDFIRESNGAGPEMDDNALLDALSKPEAIIERYGRLAEDSRRSIDWLRDPASPSHEEPPDGPESTVELIAFALAFPIVSDGGDHEGFEIPLDVRVVLHRADPSIPTDLAVHLALLEVGDLEALAAIHQVEASSAEPVHLERAARVAAAILDKENIETLFQTLEPHTAAILVWFSSAENPEKFTAKRPESLGLHGITEEKCMAAVHVLNRLGLLIESEPSDTGEIGYFLPCDTRVALRFVVEAALDGQCASAFKNLEAKWLAVAADCSARSVGAVAVSRARCALVGAVAGGFRPNNVVDQLLVDLNAFDPEEQLPGEFASRVLDVRSSDAFARSALKLWLTFLEDRFSEELFGAFNVSIDDLNQELYHNQSADSAGHDRQRRIWEEILYDVRAGLLVTIGLLSDDRWYSVRQLAAWACAHTRNVLFHIVPEVLVDLEICEPLLPITTQPIPSSLVVHVEQALASLLVSLLEPIGAVCLDDTRRHFSVNPEAFRLFEPGTSEFERLVGEPLEKWGETFGEWLPAPTERSGRDNGLVTFHWVDSTTIEVPADAHLHDLLTLAAWAETTFDGTSFRFTIQRDRTEASAQGVDAGELERLVTWLMVRSSYKVPDQARALFPICSTAADFDRHFAQQAATGEVAMLYSALDTWGDIPPLHLMEELRSWGEPAAQFLLGRFEEAVQTQQFDDPRIRHAIILLGELCVNSHASQLADILQTTTDEKLEATAAMALARMGARGIKALSAALHNGYLDIHKRLVACGALTTLSILHPALADRCVDQILRFVNFEEWDNDVVTYAGIHLAESGHPKAREFLEQARDQRLWDELVTSLDDALWLCDQAPSIWGHPMLSGPLSHIFPTQSECEEMMRASGVEDIMKHAGFDDSRTMAHLPRRKKPGEN